MTSQFLAGLAVTGAPLLALGYLLKGLQAMFSTYVLVASALIGFLAVTGVLSNIGAKVTGQSPRGFVVDFSQPRTN